MEFSIKKFIKDLTINSLYYRTEIVCGIAGFIIGVAAATLLFEALRQRKVKGIAPESGEGLTKQLYENIIFEWAYPQVAKWCKLNKRKYPKLNDCGEILEDLPRTIKRSY